MKVKLSPQFDRMMQRAGELFQKRLEEESQKMLTEERRSYPRTTERDVGAGKTGKTAGSPRDVVDTGGLVNSFETELKKRGKSVAINQRWTAEHAAIVYAGWTSENGTDVPPWQWMKEITEYVTFEQMVQEAIQQAKQEVFGK